MIEYVRVYTLDSQLLPNTCIVVTDPDNEILYFGDNLGYILEGYTKHTDPNGKVEYRIFNDNRVYEPGTVVTRSMTRFSASGTHAKPVLADDDLKRVEAMPCVKDVDFLDYGSYMDVVARYVNGEYKSKIRAVRRYTQQRIDELQDEIEKLSQQTEQKIGSITADFIDSFETRLKHALLKED